MAGFTKLKYMTDNGSIFFCRLEDYEGTKGLYGDAPEGEVTEDMTLVSTKSRRGFGIHPRGVLLARTVGTDNAGGAPLAYTTDAKLYKFVPIGTETTFDAQEVGEDAEAVTIKGIAWKPVRKIKESVV